MKESPSKSVRQLERKSSIESEPQTLSLDQLQYAREAALYVLNTNSFEEAINIFTEGLQPVCVVVNDMDSDELDWVEKDEVDASLLERMRDIVTAPF